MRDPGHHVDTKSMLNKKIKHSANAKCSISPGGADGIRTHDLLTASRSHAFYKTLVGFVGVGKSATWFLDSLDCFISI